MRSGAEVPYQHYGDYMIVMPSLYSTKFFFWRPDISAAWLLSVLEIAKISHQEVLRQDFVSGFGVDAGNLAFTEWKVCWHRICQRHALQPVSQKTHCKHVPSAQIPWGKQYCEAYASP